MATEWYYTRGTEQMGPVSSEELKQLAASGELGPDDLVWKEGMEDWRPAGQLKGLLSAGSAEGEGAATVAVSSAGRPVSAGRPDSEPGRPAFWQIPFLVGSGLLVIAMFLPWWSITISGTEDEFEEAFSKVEAENGERAFARNGDDGVPRRRTRRKPDADKYKYLWEKTGWYLRNSYALSVDVRSVPMDNDDESLDIRGRIWGWNSSLGRLGGFLGLLVIPLAVTMMAWPAARRFSFTTSFLIGYIGLILLVMTLLWYFESPGYDESPVLTQNAHVGPYLVLVANLVLLVSGILDGLFGLSRFRRERAG